MQSGRSNLVTVRRSRGCVTDAVWLRTHEWSPDMLLQDIRFAVRTHLKRPGFAAVAILTLALGIGANTALFSVVNGLLLEPLPYEEPERLVRLYGTNSTRGLTHSNLNPNDMLDIGAQAESVLGASYYSGFSATMQTDTEPTRLIGGSVHSTFFQVLGVDPHQGRFFSAEENVDGNHRVLVLGYDTWQVLFGADPQIVGRSVDLGDIYTIIGIAPPGFVDPFGGRQMWTPWAIDSENRGGHFMRAVGRLAPGVSLEQAQQDIDGAYVAIGEEYGKQHRGIRAEGLQTAMVADSRPLVLLLFGAVGFLLLIVCANIASLMLARAVNRRQEIAVRMALGAGRGRLVRQMVTESWMLAAAGGIAGVALASWLIKMVGGAAATAIPGGLFDISLDARVLAFSLVVTLGAGVLFGLAPALQGTRAELADSLRERGADRSSSGRRRLRSGLVVAEVAISLMLLIGAGLMLRSMGNLMAVDPGFEPTGVLSFRIVVPESDYPEYPQIPAFYETFMANLEALPGVESVGAVNRLPFSGSYSCDWFMLEGWPMPERGQGECAEERVIAGDYFQTMGIQIVGGRGLESTDTADNQRVILVSQTMADRFIAGEDPLGRGFTWGPVEEDTNFRRVVGVVADVKHLDLTSDAMTEVYMPHEQYPYYRRMTLVVRAQDPLALLPAAKAALSDQDANIAMYEVSTLDGLVADSVAPTRTSAQILGAFAVLALVLACVGLYGVLAYTVSQRTHEFGVRMALGAQRGSVVSMVLRQAMTLVAIGVVLGLFGAWALSGSLAGVLFGVTPDDPATYLLISGVLVAVAAMAAFMPASRATRVDPVRALRDE